MRRLFVRDHVPTSRGSDPLTIDAARSEYSSPLPPCSAGTALLPVGATPSTLQGMETARLLHRFDVFERRQSGRLKFVVWRGTYRSLAEAQEKLDACAAESHNEFYVKDLELGVVVARVNVSDGAAA
jgi:hypothetical protein